MKKLYRLFYPPLHTSSLGHKFRQKRISFFNDIINQLPKSINILDVGSSEDFWINVHYQDSPNFQITIINLTIKKNKYPNLITKIGDATDLTKYKNKEFDLVFSNSVIESHYLLP